MRIRLFAAMLTLAIPAMLRAADPAELMRVYPDGQHPNDPRYVVHDIDNPVDFTGRFADKAAWEERAAFLRQQLLVANGLLPMPEKTPLNAVIHGKIDRDEYTIEKVYFASMPGHYVSGNLYRPKNTKGKVPAVLCPHGHWNNGRLMWTAEANAKKEIAAGAEDWLAGGQSPLQARCAMLARMGCIVFHYDMVGVADSNKLVHRKGMTDVESVLRLQSQMGLQTWNSIRALDFVTSLPEVDATRIGVTGASGGGSQTFMVGAVDPRVSVTFPAVMVGMNMQGGCVCENAPLLRVGTNNVEIAALMAPKPVAMSAANDWTVDLEYRGLPEARLVYKLYKTDKLKKPEDLITAKHFDFPHNYNQRGREMMEGWMNQHLMLGYPTPVQEKPFEPVPVKDLSVWDDKHPVPTDALENDALRKAMTAASDKQMAALAENPEKYRDAMHGALEGMIVDRYPLPQGVRVGRHSGPVRLHGMTIERGEVERIADGTKVPYVAGIPDDWNGTVVIWATEKGKQSILEADHTPTPELAAMLQAKVAVIAPDLFWTGEFLPDGKAVPAPGAPDYAPKSNPSYAAFNLGYNRSVVGNRVHDLLGVTAMARGWIGTKSVRVLATGKAGPWGLLAKAAGGKAIDMLAADLDQFDFDKVTEAGDPMLLPGALKYGGIYSFVPLCNTGSSQLVNCRKTGKFELAKMTEGVTLAEEKKPTAALVEWIVK